MEKTINNQQSIINNRFGFTLVEMLITVAILGILSSTSVIGYRAQIEKANDGARKKELVKIKVALEDYYSSKNCYPENLPACGESFEPYLLQMPCEPGGKTSYRYTPQEDTSCPQYYRLYTKLGNSSDPVISQAGCSSGCGPDAAYNWGVSSDNVGLVSATEAPSSPSPSPSQAPTCGQYSACFGTQCNIIPGSETCSKISFCSSNCSGGCVDGEGLPISSKQCN